MACDYAWVSWCPESVFALAVLNDQQKLAALTIFAAYSRARGAWRWWMGGGRREVGGWRTAIGSINFVEGICMVSLALTGARGQR